MLLPCPVCGSELGHGYDTHEDYNTCWDIMFMLIIDAPRMIKCGACGKIFSLEEMKHYVDGFIPVEREGS